MNAVTITYDAAGTSPAARPANDAGCTGTRSAPRTLVAPARQLGAIQRVAAAVAKGGATEDFMASRLARQPGSCAPTTRCRPGRPAAGRVRLRTCVDAGRRCSGGETVAAAVRPVDVARGRAGPALGPRASLLFGRSCADALAVPVCVAGRIHGAIAVGSGRPAGWDEDAVPSLRRSRWFSRVRSW